MATTGWRVTYQTLRHDALAGASLRLTAFTHDGPATCSPKTGPRGGGRSGDRYVAFLMSPINSSG